MRIQLPRGRIARVLRLGRGMPTGRGGERAPSSFLVIRPIGVESKRGQNKQQSERERVEEKEENRSYINNNHEPTRRAQQDKLKDN